MKHPKRVEVSWLDSFAMNQHWHYVEEFKDSKNDGYEKTIGYLIKQEKDRIVLASCLSRDMQNVGGIFIIPKGCIKKVKYI